MNLSENRDDTVSLIKIEISHKYGPKSRFIKNFSQNQDFVKILTKIEIFVNFYENPDYRKFWQKQQIFINFKENQDIVVVLIKIEILRMYGTK